MYIGYYTKAELKRQIKYIETAIAIIPKEIKTKNRYKNILRKCSNKEKELVSEIYKSIVHIQTAMNRINRVQEKDYYITTREDVIVSLNIIYNLLEEKKKDEAEEKQVEAIKDLVRHSERSEESQSQLKNLITRKELGKILNRSKTDIHRIVKQQEAQGNIKLVEIKKQTHYYKIINKLDN